MSFKVGDKVRVLSIPYSAYGNPKAIREKFGTDICSISSRGEGSFDYSILINGENEWGVNACNLTHLVPVNDLNQPFPKKGEPYVPKAPAEPPTETPFPEVDYSSVFQAPTSAEVRSEGSTNDEEEEWDLIPNWHR